MHSFFNTRERNLPRMNHLREFLKNACSGWAAKKERKTRDEKIPKGPCPPRQPPLWPGLQGFSLAPGPPFGPPRSLSALHKAASHVIWGTKELTLLPAPTQWPPHWGLSSFNRPNDRFHPLSPDEKEEQELTHHLSLLPPFTSPPLSTPPKSAGSLYSLMWQLFTVNDTVIALGDSFVLARHFMLTFTWGKCSLQTQRRAY